MKRLLALVLPFLFVVAASAREPDLIWVIRNVTDLPLGQAVQETAALGGIEVEVEPALREKRITLLLDAPVVGALKALAEAAGGHLWKLGDKKYAVRAEPPPPSAVPPREEIEDPLDDGTEPAPRPEWEQKIRKALDETPYEGEFKDTPLPEFLAALAKQAGVPIYLDPAVLRSRSKKELQVEFSDVLGGSSVYEALTLYCGFNDLAFHVQWGVVFVTSGARLMEMPESVFLPGSGEPDGKLSVVLESRLGECRLKKAALKKAVAMLAKASKVEIAIDEAALKLCRGRKFSVDFTGRTLGDALAILLVPEGLALQVEESGLRVVVRP